MPDITLATGAYTCCWASWDSNYGTAAAGYAAETNTTSTINSAFWDEDYSWFPSNLPVTITLQPEETEEARAARVASQAQQRAERRKAEARAKKLLLTCLTPEQRNDWEKEQAFRVISADGERIYQIKRGRCRNVQLLNPEGQVIRHYCAHPIEDVPDDDTVLAQKLMLETCEQEFLRLANAS